MATDEHTVSARELVARRAGLPHVDAGDLRVEVDTMLDQSL